MKRRYYRHLILVFLFAFSCKTNPDYGSIGLAINIPEDYLLSSKRVLIESEAFQSIELEINELNVISHTIDDVEPGQWTITVNLINDDGIILYTESLSVTVNINEITSITFDNFQIKNESLTVLSPNGGEVWTLNDDNGYSITWERTHPENTVNIKLYKNNSYYSTVASSTDNNGGGTWKPSNNDYVGGDDYKIRIESTNNSNISDISNGNFTLVDPFFVLYDDFSNQTINWTVDSGNWFLQNGKLRIDGPNDSSHHKIFKNTSSSFNGPIKFSANVNFVSGSGQVYYGIGLTLNNSEKILYYIVNQWGDLRLAFYDPNLPVGGSRDGDYSWQVFRSGTGWPKLTDLNSSGRIKLELENGNATVFINQWDLTPAYIGENAFNGIVLFHGNIVYSQPNDGNAIVEFEMLNCGLI